MGIFSKLFGSRPSFGTPGIGDDLERWKDWSTIDPGAGMEGPAGPAGDAGKGGGIADILGKVGSMGDGLAQAAALAAGDTSGYAALQKQPRKTLAEELMEYEARKKIDRQYDRPSQPYRWEDNAGNLMEIGDDGNPRRRYEDPTPRMNFIPDGMGGGRWVPLPGAEPLPTKPVGKITPIPESAGQGDQFSQEQYRGLVSVFGKSGADDYLRKHGLTVRGY